MFLRQTIAGKEQGKLLSIVNKKISANFYFFKKLVQHLAY